MADPQSEMDEMRLEWGRALAAERAVVAQAMADLRSEVQASNREIVIAFSHALDEVVSKLGLSAAGPGVEQCNELTARVLSSFPSCGSKGGTVAAAAIQQNMEHNCQDPRAILRQAQTHQEVEDDRQEQGQEGQEGGDDSELGTIRSRLLEVRRRINEKTPKRSPARAHSNSRGGQLSHSGLSPTPRSNRSSLKVPATCSTSSSGCDLFTFRTPSPRQGCSGIPTPSPLVHGSITKALEGVAPWTPSVRSASPTTGTTPPSCHGVPRLPLGTHMSQPSRVSLGTRMPQPLGKRQPGQLLVI
mmetsp:Transcript_107095/g.212609  ORF Transcript_107095/g.212609 Transcript_107095/m.212609 type:complete len:301 (-) Transcript_107095:1060-1962(-)